MYTHYTVAFVLVAQLCGCCGPTPRRAGPRCSPTPARRSAILPWLTGLRADLDSPTTDILSALAPVTADTITTGLAHWSVGYPYQYDSTGLLDLPGPVALVLLGLGVALAAAGLALRVARRSTAARLAQIEPGLVLVVGLALATPVGDGPGERDRHERLRGSQPGRFLARLRAGARGLPRGRRPPAARRRGGAHARVLRHRGRTMLDDSFAPPRLPGRRRELVDREAAPRDPVIDAAVVTPGPLSGLDVVLERPHRCSASARRRNVTIPSPCSIARGRPARSPGGRRGRRRTGPCS